MKQGMRQNKIILSVLACAFLIVFAVVLTRSFSVHAGNETPYDADFDQMSRAGADYLSMVVSEQITADMNGGEAPPWPDDIRSGGSLLGFGTKPTLSYNIQHPWFSINSDDVGSYRYDSFEQTAPVDTEPFRQYANLGRVLNALGLDQTNANAFDVNIRKVVGTVMTALYLLANFINEFWIFVINILELANPFRLFTGVDKADALLSGMTGVTPGTETDYRHHIFGDADSGMAAISGFIKDFYTVLQTNAFTLTIPLILVCSIFIWLVVHKGRGGGKTVKNTVIRLVFAAIGVPIMLSCYTTVIQMVKTMTIHSSYLTSDIVTSTFFDFEKHVGNSFCTLLAQDDIKAAYSSAGDIDLSILNKARGICAKLNDDKVVESYGNMLKIHSALPLIHMSGVPDVDSTSGINAYNEEYLKQLWEPSESDGKIADDDQAKYHAMVLDMLNRYTEGTKVSAGSVADRYVLHYNSVFMPSGHSGDHPALSLPVLLVSSKWEYFLPQISNGIKSNIKYGAATISTAWYQAMSRSRFKDNPATVSNGGGGGGQYDIAEAELLNMTSALWGKSARIGRTAGASDPSGLSFMAMYNYLSSSFDEDEIHVYSAKDTKANSQKVEHYAVNIVGSELMRIVFLANAIILLVASSVIGYVYGISLIVSNFKAMIRMIPNIFVGTLGSMRGIASALIMTAGLVFDVLITCVVYNLGMQLVAYSFSLICGPICELMSDLFSTKWGIFAVVSGIVSIAFIAFYIKKMIDYRYAICMVANDAVTGIVNKMLGTNVNASAVAVTTQPSTKMMAAGVGAIAAGNIMGSDPEKAKEMSGKITANVRLRAHELGETLGISSESSGERNYRDLDEEKAHGKDEFDKRNKDNVEPDLDDERQADAYVSANEGFVANEGSDSENLNDDTVDNADGTVEANDAIDANDVSSDGSVNNGKGSRNASRASGSGEADEADVEIAADDADVEDDESDEVQSNSSSKGTAPVANNDLNSNGSSKMTINDNSKGIVQNDGSVPADISDNSETGNIDVSGTVGNDDVMPTVITGPDGRTYAIQNASGKAYTVGDYNSGAAYTLVDTETGEPYVDASGKIYENMPAKSMDMTAIQSGGNSSMQTGGAANGPSGMNGGTSTQGGVVDKTVNTDVTVLQEYGNGVSGGVRYEPTNAGDAVVAGGTTTTKTVVTGLSGQGQPNGDVTVMSTGESGIDGPASVSTQGARNLSTGSLNTGANGPVSVSASGSHSGAANGSAASFVVNPNGQGIVLTANTANQVDTLTDIGPMPSTKSHSVAGDILADVGPLGTDVVSSAPNTVHVTPINTGGGLALTSSIGRDTQVRQGVSGETLVARRNAAMSIGSRFAGGFAMGAMAGGTIAAMSGSRQVRYEDAGVDYQTNTSGGRTVFVNNTVPSGGTASIPDMPAGNTGISGASGYGDISGGVSGADLHGTVNTPVVDTVIGAQPSTVNISDGVSANNAFVDTTPGPAMRGSGGDAVLAGATGPMRGTDTSSVNISSDGIGFTGKIEDIAPMPSDPISVGSFTGDASIIDAGDIGSNSIVDDIGYSMDTEGEYSSADDVSFTSIHDDIDTGDSTTTRRNVNTQQIVDDAVASIFDDSSSTDDPGESDASGDGEQDDDND